MDGPNHTDDTRWPGLVERPGRGSTTWPSGLCAVLVHGAMDRGAGMAHLARQLRDVPTLRYDRRGYGRAARLPVGGLVRHVDDLVEIVGRRPVVLFGHSFGGLVVLATASTGRIDVRAIATWETPTPWIPEWPPWALADPGEVPDPAGATAEQFMRSTIGSTRFDALPARTRASRRAEGAALLADVDARLAAGPPFDPGRITVPCCFGAGENSNVPYAVGARWLAERVADGTTRIIPDAGHGAPMDRAPEIAALVRDVAHRVVRPRDDGSPAETERPAEEHDAFAV